MQSELKPCPFCGDKPIIEDGANDRPWVVQCINRDCTAQPFMDHADTKRQAITAWNTRASDAEITRLTEALRAAEEREKALREALESKPWPPTDADLREMLALIVGAWWSESSANRLRAARMLNAEDIKGMYAVRDALAPYIARAALKGPSHDA